MHKRSDYNADIVVTTNATFERLCMLEVVTL